MVSLTWHHHTVAAIWCLIQECSLPLQWPVEDAPFVAMYNGPLLVTYLWSLQPRLRTRNHMWKFNHKPTVVILGFLEVKNPRMSVKQASPHIAEEDGASHWLPRLSNYSCAPGWGWRGKVTAKRYCHFLLGRVEHVRESIDSGRKSSCVLVCSPPC